MLDCQAQSSLTELRNGLEASCSGRPADDCCVGRTRAYSAESRIGRFAVLRELNREILLRSLPSTMSLDFEAPRSSLIQGPEGSAPGLACEYYRNLDPFNWYTLSLGRYTLDQYRICLPCLLNAQC